jgi:hypothetical protein
MAPSILARRFVPEREQCPRQQVHSIGAYRSVGRALERARQCRTLFGALVWLERAGQPAGRPA